MALGVNMLLTHYFKNIFNVSNDHLFLFAEFVFGGGQAVHGVFS